MVGKRDTMENRFWRHVTFCPNTGCWLWTGAIAYNGYGQIGTGEGAKTIRASRASYKIHKGDPGDLHVCHTCDFPGCVNPDHLFLGTHKENMADCSKKGRGNKPRGISHHKAKLTEDSIREIRASPEMGSELALKFGVSQQQIHRIRARTSWRQVS